MPQPNVAFNPISTGLQLGAAGAAAGLGLAAVHRAIKVHRYRHPTHTPVVRPMLAGAVIGMALGTGMAIQSRRMQATKYASLLPLLEKRSLFDRYADWQSRHPWASLGSYMIPGVGAGLSTMDAARSFGQGHILSGIGNALMIPAGLIGLGGVARGVPRMAQVARMAQESGKGVRVARNTLDAAEASKGVGSGLWAGVKGIPGQVGDAYERTWQNAGTKAFEPQLAAMSPEQTARISQWGNGLERFLGAGEEARMGNRYAALNKVPWVKNWTPFGMSQVAGVGLNIAGGVREAGQNGGME